MSSGDTQQRGGGGGGGCNGDDDDDDVDEASVRSWWNMIHWIADLISSVSVECKPMTILPNSWSWSYLYRPTLPFSTVTGTILCQTNNNTTTTTTTCWKKKKNIKGGSSSTATLKLCIQEGGPAGPPILVIDLPIASHELQGECSRIVLECERARCGGGPLMATSMWAVYFNGKKVGFGWRREAEDDHVGTALYSIRNVSAGMGLLPPTATSTLESSVDNAERRGGGGGGGYQYLRGTFEKVVGSADSESYHLLDPAGCLDGHDLSFFFVRL